MTAGSFSHIANTHLITIIYSSSKCKKRLFFHGYWLLETVNIQEHVSNAEKSTALCLKNLQTYEAKLIACPVLHPRDNLLIFNRISEWLECTRSPDGKHLKMVPRFRARPAGADEVPSSRTYYIPLIMKCLRYTDRDHLLNEASKDPPQVADIQLKFAVDYSEATTKRQKPCYKVMHESRIYGFEA